MPQLDPRPFRAETSNADILNAIRNVSSLDYQRRIPAATKANVDDVVHNLLTYRPMMNEFVDALVNRIGLEIFKYNSWTNPLAKFKRGMLNFGDTIEEVIVGLLEAKVYDPDREYLEKDIFGTERPDVQSSFHKVNRQNFYKISVNEVLLRRAFLTEYGLSGFVAQLMEAPNTSDNWDEFLLMTSLFETYYSHGGFFKINVPDVSNLDSEAPDARAMLRRMRGLAETLPFISTHYNAAGMPISAKPDELELFITPEANAALDVEALAGAFNVDRANFPSRTTVIPNEYFRIDGVQAILTTADFFVVADTLMETRSQANPVGLHTNYFLHHHQVISASRFVPAILFTTEPGDEIVINETPIESVEITGVFDSEGSQVSEVERGTLYHVRASGITNPEGGYNDAVVFEIVSNHHVGSHVTQTGMLYVSPFEAATSLTIRVHSTENDNLTEDITIPVVGDLLQLWPNPQVVPDADNDGIFEVIPDEPEFDETTDIVTIPSVAGVQYRKTVKEGVTFTDSGDIVTVPLHGAEVGDTIVFGAITDTTGVSAGVTYYVKTTPTANTMTISATPDGSTLALSTNGSAASARFDVADNSEFEIAGETDITAVAKSGYELADGATALWTFDV
jgi:hypothetical protein